MNDRSAIPGLKYLTGFGNQLESEAIPGALPIGQNSPQQIPFGLYAEQFSGAAFTVPRAHNLRSWLYRLRPSAMHGAFRRVGDGGLRTAPHREADASPNRLRWNPPTHPEAPTDFIDGLVTYAAGGDARMHQGAAVHLYACNRPMGARVFYSADGELLIVPQQGTLTVATEFGVVAVAPGEIAVVPRGVKFRVDVTGPARGYVCENYGATFRLPDLGLIGANGLAAARDFQVPVAAYEDKTGPVEVIAKFAGHLWATELAHSPLDVVAWHGNCAPYKYDLAHFNVINTVSFDHPDPSIFTVLTSQSDTPGTANCDFVIFPPRWMVAEHSFRAPYFHRNVMSEFMGLVRGEYDAKSGGFLPGGASLHNCMSAHGPDKVSYERGIAEKLEPHKLANTLAIMFETRFILEPTAWALASPTLQADYEQAWAGIVKATNFKAID